MITSSAQTAAGRRQIHTMPRRRGLIPRTSVSNGRQFSVMGKDGITRTLVQWPAKMNDIAGRFEWIINPRWHRQPSIVRTRRWHQWSADTTVMKDKRRVDYRPSS